MIAPCWGMESFAHMMKQVNGTMSRLRIVRLVTVEQSDVLKVYGPWGIPECHTPFFLKHNETENIPYLVTRLKLTQATIYPSTMNGSLYSGVKGPMLHACHSSQPRHKNIQGHTTTTVSVCALPEASGIHRCFHRNLCTVRRWANCFWRKQIQLPRSFVVP